MQLAFGHWQKRRKMPAKAGVLSQCMMLRAGWYELNKSVCSVVRANRLLTNGERDPVGIRPASKNPHKTRHAPL